MENLVLVSKKGKEVTVRELLDTLTVANSKCGLAVKYVNQKPTLVFVYNAQGPLTMVSASVCFAMLTSKFAIEKSTAYEIAAWLSSNFSESAPAVTPAKTLLTEEELEEKLLHKAMLISLLETIDKKMTKAEMLKVIEEAKSFIKDGE